MPRFITKALKYGSPIFIVVFTISAIYSALFPWPPMQAEINKYPHSFAVMTGYQASSSDAGTEKAETYLLIDFKNLASSTINLTEYPNGERKLVTQPGGILGLMLTLAIVIFSTYWYWFRKQPKTS